jgi:N6-adenosine-specific RNA methylase IME4
MTRDLAVNVNLFPPLPLIGGGWPNVHADPPWGFRSNSAARPGRNAMRHYRCLSPDQIASLPLKDVVAQDALLWLWVPGPFLVVGAHIPIMRAWGFAPTAMGFTWVKLKRSFEAGRLQVPSIAESDLHIGLGHTTRKNAEFRVLGRRGNPRRLAVDVREIVLSPVGRHSEKPLTVYDISRYGDGPYLDLFARESRPGWTPWGDQIAAVQTAQAAAIPLPEAAE